MMLSWFHDHAQHQVQDLTTEQQLALVRHELDELERRLNFIEATIDAIRRADDLEGHEP